MSSAGPNFSQLHFATDPTQVNAEKIRERVSGPYLSLCRLVCPLQSSFVPRLNATVTERSHEWISRSLLLAMDEAPV
jgi:hypothetical protein